MKRNVLIILAAFIAGTALTLSLWRFGLVELPYLGLYNPEHKHGAPETHDHPEKKDMVVHENHAEHGEEDHDKNGEGAEEHAEQDVVSLSDKEIKEFGIELAVAGPGMLHTVVSLPGEVRINEDRLIHVVPRVSGVVREVRKNLGDGVRAGEVMVVISSRELADLRSAYLAALERADLARADFERVEKLYKRKITAEKEYLRARKELAEARIELRAAEQKLRALGFTAEEIRELPEKRDQPFTRYEVIAPIDGTVIKKHVVLGEAVKDDSLLYVVADLSTVWVDLSVYPKDLPFVSEGQEVTISAGRGIPDARGRISYVGPVVGEETRTAVARVVLPNPKGKWRPGLFVTGNIAVDDIPVKLMVPRTALQTVEGVTSIFIEAGKDLFRPVPVVTGRTNETHVEIVDGLEQGQRYVSKGAFTLKAQLSKAEFGEGHTH